MMQIDLSTIKPAPMQAPRIVLYGPIGCGKTTMACQAKDVVLLDLESGRVKNTPKLPLEPRSSDEVLAILDALIVQDHDYKTLVIDTLDCLEEMITNKLCTANNWKSIMDPGFGKGTDARTREWSKFWYALDEIRRVRGMVIILIAHSKLVKFEDPMLPAYDMYTLNLYRNEAEKAQDWPDVVGFCHIKTYTSKAGTTERMLASSAGVRVMCVQNHPAYAAKNRYGMPEELPLNWAEFAKYFTTKQE